MDNTYEEILLHEHWHAFRSSPDKITSPEHNEFKSLPKIQVIVPGSLFKTLESHYELSELPEDYDWWYIHRFECSTDTKFDNALLQFECLASLSEVWLNGEALLQSNNMFTPHEINISDNLQNKNELIICFRSVNHFLKTKRPRPRWKTNLITHQQLRWLRTSLLGRMPGWTPPTPALGPCGNIKLKLWKSCHLAKANITTQIEGTHGHIRAKFEFSGRVDSATLFIGSHATQLSLAQAGLTQTSKTEEVNHQEQKKIHSGMIAQGELIIEYPELWWPATHGEQNSYTCHIEALINGCTQRFELEKCHFRHIEVNRNTTSFSINHQKIFVRGACWTHAGLTSFRADKESLRKRLILAKEAGINMLRIGGTMSYESDEFYRLCDELGVMVWQDFMFANMDYPFYDPNFLACAKAEIDYQLFRLSQHACIVTYCGNSEIQQQAAMLGLPSSEWSKHFFDEDLKEACEALHPGVPYFSSTPMGGAMPFHLSSGISHFYGVGAYKKPLLGSGIKEVKFASESLGFSHIPSQSEVNKLFNQEKASCHAPAWKRGVPRDKGAGWDFEDIRDYYLEKLYQTDPVTLRSRDTERYLEVSRTVPGEMITQVFSQWRSKTSECSGALIWQYNDLMPGAGWGVIDHKGLPKSSYFYLKRAFQPVAAFIADRELDGLSAILVNDSTQDLHLDIAIKLISTPDRILTEAHNQVTIKANSTWENSVDAIIGHFTDPNYSYKFGSKQHNIVALQAFNSGSLISDAFYFTESLNLNEIHHSELTIDIETIDSRTYLNIESSQFLHAVILDIKDASPKDNYFNLTPNTPRKIEIILNNQATKTLKGYVSALNLYTPKRIKLQLECPECD